MMHGTTNIKFVKEPLQWPAGPHYKTDTLDSGINFSPVQSRRNKNNNIATSIGDAEHRRSLLSLHHKAIYFIFLS